MPQSGVTHSFQADALLSRAVEAEPALLARLRRLVEIESPSHDFAAVNQCLAAAAEIGTQLGATARRHRSKISADVLELRFASRKKGRPLLLLGHLDTVWPMGTLAKMPYHHAEKDGEERGDERIWGPGVLDMKAGVAMALTALEILQQAEWLQRPVTLLLVGDEEVGSQFSRSITERLAQQSSAVFVLEPAQGIEGAYKTSRKGVGDYTLRVEGVAAHSGLDFTSGHSAIHELAHQMEKIREFTDLKRGVTVSAGMIRGGSARNVIAAHAEADFDVRVTRAADAARIDRRFQKLRPRDSGCVLSVEGGVNRPPMERSRGTVALFRQATKLARELGFTLSEAASGGGSDGNFTAALGVPTLDGMGAVGEGAHAVHESVVRRHLAPRTALLAAMIASAER
jgi:glutamate carboxypeptidase